MATNYIKQKIGVTDTFASESLSDSDYYDTPEGSLPGGATQRPGSRRIAKPYNPSAAKRQLNYATFTPGTNFFTALDARPSGINWSLLLAALCLMSPFCSLTSSTFFTSSK